jgi:hypothetical protein
MADNYLKNMLGENEHIVFKRIPAAESASTGQTVNCQSIRATTGTSEETYNFTLKT